MQGYNGQAAVDAGSQVIVADSNYCSESNLEALAERGVRGYLATGRQKHGTRSPTSGDKKGSGTRVQEMRLRLKRAGHRSRYRLRKQVVEPVFGHIKEARGFRRFMLRGIDQVRAEWSMLCTAHNLLKLAAART